MLKISKATPILMVTFLLGSALSIEAATIKATSNTELNARLDSLPNQFMETINSIQPNSVADATTKKTLGEVVTVEEVQPQPMKGTPTVAPLDVNDLTNPVEVLEKREQAQKDGSNLNSDVAPIYTTSNLKEEVINQKTFFSATQLEIVILIILVFIIIYKIYSDISTRNERREIHEEKEMVKTAYEKRSEELNLKLREFTKLTESNLKNIQLNTKLALIATTFEGVDKLDALIELEKTIFDYPIEYRNNLYFLMGYCSESLQDKVKYYSKVIDADYRYKGAFNYRGLAYFFLNKFELALTDYTKELDSYPDSKITYYNRGNAYVKLGRYAEAIKDYNKAIALKLEGKEVYNNRGIAKYNLGKFAEAIVDYEKAISIYPNYTEAINNKEIAKSRLNNYLD